MPRVKKERVLLPVDKHSAQIGQVDRHDRTGDAGRTAAGDHRQPGGRQLSLDDIAQRLQPEPPIRIDLRGFFRHAAIFAGAPDNSGDGEVSTNDPKPRPVDPERPSGSILAGIGIRRNDKTEERRLNGA